MAWSFDSKKIAVQKISEGMKQIIAQVQPLSGGTVYQMFGYESDRVKLSGLVVGSANVASLKGLRKTGLSYALVSPEGSLGNYFLSSISTDREKSTWQSIDLSGGLTCTDPVFTVELELLADF